MAAFAGDGHRAVRRRRERTDAETRAGSDDADRSAFDRRAAADLQAILVAKVRDRRGIGDEVIDDAEPSKIELPPQAFDGKRPWMIGQRHLVAGDRRRDGEHRLQRPRGGRCFGQVGLDRIGKRRMIVQGVDARGRGCTVWMNQGEADVGRADISDQSDAGL